jgi:hypothetical protein
MSKLAHEEYGNSFLEKEPECDDSCF